MVNYIIEYLATQLAIFDAFEILSRIQEEEAILNEQPITKKESTFKGFAERRSK